MFSSGCASEPPEVVGWGGGGLQIPQTPAASCRAGLPLRDLQGATKDMERQGPQTFTSLLERGRTFKK